jgi:hypothetical protein
LRGGSAAETKSLHNQRRRRTQNHRASLGSGHITLMYTPEMSFYHSDENGEYYGRESAPPDTATSSVGYSRILDWLEGQADWLRRTGSAFRRCRLLYARQRRGLGECPRSSSAKSCAATGVLK